MSWTTSQIVELLRERYSPPKNAFCTEVPNGTGMNKSRTCDAMAIGCWKSEGIELSGFEVKVSRSDWQKEMQQPQKASAFEIYCNRWYIVSPLKGVVKIEELPAAWGWMYPTKSNNLRIGKPAQLNKSPEPIPMAMLAGMIRRAMNCNRDLVEQNRAVEDSYSNGFSAGVESEKKKREHNKQEENRTDVLHKKAIDEFERASGLKIRSYRGKQLGEAVKLVTEIQDFNVAFLLERLEKLQSAAKEVQQLCAEPVRTLTAETGRG